MFTIGTQPDLTRGLQVMIQMKVRPHQVHLPGTTHKCSPRTSLALQRILSASCMHSAVISVSQGEDYVKNDVGVFL